MRAVIQRVSRASVTIRNAVKGRIEKGLLVLLAIEEADGSEDIEWLSGKIVRLRVFQDDLGRDEPKRAGNGRRHPGSANSRSTPAREKATARPTAVPLDQIRPSPCMSHSYNG